MRRATDAAASAPTAPGSSTVASSSAAASCGSPSPCHSSTARRHISSISSSADGMMPAARDRGDGDAGGLERGERADDRALLAAAERQELEGHLGDDAERALGPDHQRGEVVAGRALRGAAAEPHDLAVGEHDRHAEHVVARHAVLDAADAAGVGRRRCRRSSRSGSSPGRADTRARARRRRCRRSSLITPGLGDDVPARRRSTSSTRVMRSSESDDRAPRARSRRPRDRCRRRAPRRCSPCGRGEPDDGGHVLGRLGQHDGERPVELRPLGVVVRVGVALGRVGEHLIGAEDVEEPCDRRVGSSGAAGSRRA